MNELATDSTITKLAQLRQLIDWLEKWRNAMIKALYYTDGTHTFDDLAGMILTNQLYFFCTDKAFAVCEIVQYPQYNNLHCFLAGGDMDELLEHIDDLRRLGESLGCRYFTMAGRKGWSRVLAKQGWSHACTTMSIPI